LVPKLKSRLAKAYFNLRDYKNAAQYDPTIEKYQFAEGVESQLKDRFLDIKTTRSDLYVHAEWYPIGNEICWSLIERKFAEEDGNEEEPKIVTYHTNILDLAKKKYKTFRFFFGGVGDPRHMCRTIYNFYTQLKNQDDKFFKDFKLEFHANDIVPEVIARDIMLLLALNELQEIPFEKIAQEEKTDSPSREMHLATYLYLLWLGVGFPPAQYEVFQRWLEKLLDEQQSSHYFATDTTKSSDKWITINEHDVDMTKKIWKRWKSDQTSLDAVCKEVIQNQEELREHRNANPQFYPKRKSKMPPVEKVIDKIGLDNLINATYGKKEKKKVKAMDKSRQRRYFRDLIEEFEISTSRDVQESWICEYTFFNSSGLAKPPDSVFQRFRNSIMWYTNPTVLQLQLSNEKNSRNHVPTTRNRNIHELTDDPDLLKGELATVFKVTMKQMHVWATAINFFIKKGCLVSNDENIIAKEC
jgi:hypothetical protein